MLAPSDDSEETAEGQENCQFTVHCPQIYQLLPSVVFSNTVVILGLTSHHAHLVSKAAFCIYGFRMILSVNSDYFRKQH
jgi:hypothetical protein